MSTATAPTQAELKKFYALMPRKIKNELDPIYPAKPVYPLPGKEAPYGINLASLDADQKNLTCWLMLPDSPSTYRIGLWLLEKTGGGPKILTTELPAGSSGLVSFSVPTSKLTQGIKSFYAMVTDVTANKLYRLPKASLKIDFEAPGGDVDPSGIQTKFPLPTAVLTVPGEISGSDLQSGITITVPPYPGMKLWDTVEVTIGDRTIRSHVDKTAEVNQPLTLRAEPEDLDCLFGKKQVSINYRVVDEVGNPSQYSGSTTYKIDYVQNPQSAPVFTGVGIDTGKIDLAQLAPGQTSVSVATDQLQPNEVVTLSWSLTSDKGEALSGEAVETVVSSVQDLTFDLLELLGPALQAGHLQVSYSVPGRNRSEKATATLSGEAKQHPLSVGADVSLQVGLRYIILKGRPPAKPSAGSKGAYRRKATGGKPPYTYASSNPGVAKVDEKGLVIAQGNGSADISVRDAAGDTAKYKITFSGVRLVEVRPNQVWSGEVRSGTRPEMHSLSQLQMKSFWEQYKDEDPGQSVAQLLGWKQSVFWSGDNYYVDGTAFIVDFAELDPDFRGENRRSGGTALPSLARVGWK